MIDWEGDEVDLAANPWLELRDSGQSFVLSIDSVQLRANKDEGKATEIIAKSIPEPFIGNPKSARLVLLGLNPGHDPSDESYHSNPVFRSAMFKNLSHEVQDYPFYPLNPAPIFRTSGAGRWWQKRTQSLQEATGLDATTFASRLMVIEWFPYHSKRFRVPAHIFESQRYSFHLAKQMLEQGACVVGMRSKTLWTRTDRIFGDIPYLKNPQCGYITRGNTEERLFDRMVQALKES